MSLSGSPESAPSEAPAPSAAVSRKPELTVGRALLSGFILFHVAAIVSYSIPPTSLVMSAFEDVVRPYMLWTGLWQAWAMFAPDPPSYNNYLEAEVTYRGGDSATWKFPVPVDYGYYRRYFMERYRKWGNDYVRTDANSALWPDAARYVARVMNTRRQSPDTVRLVRYWSRIPPPDSARTAGPAHWDSHVFFTYAVAPRDLQ